MLINRLLTVRRHLIPVGPNFTYSCLTNLVRKLHISVIQKNKVFQDFENTHAYNIVGLVGRFAPQVSLYSPSKEITSIEERLRLDWRKSKASQIVEMFQESSLWSKTHKIPLSSHKFDNLVDGLMDNCEHLTDQELINLLESVKQFHPCDSFNSHNYHDVWSCLDDICCWRMTEWPIEKRLEVADQWYQLNLGALCDYIFEILDFAANKVRRLARNKREMLHILFYFNICRRKKVLFDYEHHLVNEVSNYSVDELAVIAMAYFKSESRIKLEGILNEMIIKVTKNAETINDITLSAILKCIRYSKNFKTVEHLDEMMNKLTLQIPRLSTITCLHLALIGTGVQYRHEVCLEKATNKILENIGEIRLKDIERILLANVMFDRKCPSLYQAALEQLHQDKRRPEIIKYFRCLPSALHYLSFHQLYSHELMDYLLNPELILEYYGKSPKYLPRELFSLDCSIEIECPEYSGKRLTPTLKYKAAKWQTEYAPSPNQPTTLSQSDRFYLDVANHLSEIVGGPQNIHHDHALPHFAKPDMIFCIERSSGKFVEPFGFQRYIFGDVKWTPEDARFQWFALVILVPNTTIRGTSLPLGHMVIKKRQLTKIGYTPFYIIWNQFQPLSKEEKLEEIQKCIKVNSVV